MKKIIVSFLGLSLFLVAGCSRPGFLGIQSPNDNQPPKEDASQAPVTAKNATAKAALSEIYDQIRTGYGLEGKLGLLDEQINLRDQADLKTKSRWITGKGYNALVQNSIGFLDVNYDSPKDLADVAENIFLSKNFKLNKANSSVSKTDFSSMAEIEGDFPDYTRAYIFNNEEYCLITATDSAPNNFKVGCFTSEDVVRDLANQIPFLLGLKTDNKLVTVVPIILGKKAAKLNMGYRTASSSVIMIKDGNAWEEVYRGTADPECSLMAKLQIPAEIYKTCIE